MVRAATKQVNRQFSSMEWLSEEWSQLDDHDFSEQDIDRLLTHFRTDYGRKQIMIVDHGVAVHVQGALTFTGKMVYELPGSEDDRSLMQRAYDDEDQTCASISRKTRRACSSPCHPWASGTSSMRC
jgi:hypothetical protein